MELKKHFNSTYLNARGITEYEMMLVKVSVHCQPTTDSFLFDNTELDYNKNCETFLVVQTFVTVDSKRFKP